MRKIILCFLIEAACGIIFYSCDKDEDLLGNLNVKLSVEENISLIDVDVKLINVIDNTDNMVKTDAEGVAFFENIPAGTYNIVVSDKNSAENLIITGTSNDVGITSNKTTDITLLLNGINPTPGLVIKELYTCGANDGYSSLFKDQFIEIFNNSGETMYADGISVANLYGETGTANSTTEVPITDVLIIDEYVYADNIDQVPGGGTDYPIEPGKSIIIALNAMNFKENNPKSEYAVDNSTADLERYSVKWLEDQGLTGSTWFDFDNPKVPNMINIKVEAGVWLFNTYGTGAVLVDKDVIFDDSGIVDYSSGYNSTVTKLMKIPVSKIIDGVDILENSAAGEYKRLPKSIDSGFSYLKADGDAFYSSMSSRRKVDKEATKVFGRVILQDTNNSSVDFESISKPTPRSYDNTINKKVF